MEWQAGYACGAFMPVSSLRATVGTFQQERGIFGPLAAASTEDAALADLIRKTFRVSADAARVRLIKLNFLAPQDRGGSVFA